jgi:drug/metabolite transporter (DMT)-like permease
MRTHVALICVQVMFASLSVVAKLALRELPPTGLVAIRMTLAAAVFLVVWAAQGRERVAPADLARIALYAFFGLVANQLLFIEGLARTTATNAVVMGASIPVFTVGVALALGRERATPWKLVGLVVALGGALGLTGAGFQAGGERMLAGNALVLANSLSYAIYLVLTRDILRRYRTMTVVAFTFLFGALGVVPVGAAAFLHVAPAISLRAWLAVGYIVLFPTVGTYFLNAWALGRAPSSLVASYIYLQPLVGALLAAAILGEAPGAATAIAAAAIFAGIALVIADGRRLTRRASKDVRSS